MNAHETLEIISALRAAGAKHFKSGEFEISFGLNASNTVVSDPKAPSNVEPVKNEEATNKLRELINTMKLSDEELANKIFPDGAL